MKPAVESVTDEVILFRRPPPSAAVYINEIPPGCTPEEVESALNKYGLVYAVTVGWKAGYYKGYAVAQYFSRLDAQRVVEQGAREGVLVSGTRVCAKFKTSNAAAEEAKPLGLSHVINLANCYLGHDGWSTEVRGLVTEHDGDISTAGTRIRATMTLRLVIGALGGTVIDADGTAEESTSSPDRPVLSYADLMARVKKRAYNEALRAAFSQVGIYRQSRPDGKGRQQVSARVFMLAGQ